MNSRSKILVAYDFSDPAEAALLEAVRLARGSGSVILLFHAFPATVGELPVGGRKETRERLERRAGWVRTFQIEAHAILDDATDFARGVLSAIDREHPDLVLVGTHGRGRVGRLLLGSVAERVVRSASCPVLVIRDHRPRHHPADVLPGPRIIAGVDFSSASAEAIRYAARLTQLLRGYLILLHVETPDSLDHATPAGDPRVRLEQIAVSLRKRGLDVTATVTIAHDPATALLAETEGNQDAILAVGTRARSKVSSWLLGSVAQSVLRKARGPVLVAHTAEDHVSDPLAPGNAFTFPPSR